MPSGCSRCALWRIPSKFTHSSGSTARVLPYYNADYPGVYDENLSQTREFLEDSILSYQYLENLIPEKNDIILEVREKATFINITRDVKTFSHGELRLLNEIIKDRFAKNLISEPDKVPIVDTGILSQLELIDTMLGSLKINPVEEKMVGIRENGRVIVYNK